MRRRFMASARWSRDRSKVPIYRTNYAEIRARALKVAQRLDREGIKLGDRVATLGWNTWRHLESWYGIMGIGAICHTVNLRLFPEQVAWIINHAEDRIVMIDLTFVPLLEAIADKVPTVERYVIYTDRAHMPQTKLKNVVSYEDSLSSSFFFFLWIAEADGDFAWKEFDENTAAAHVLHLGHHGRPEGRAVSHRSNVLHSLIANSGDALGRDRRTQCCRWCRCSMPIAGASRSRASTGTKLALPGLKLDGARCMMLDTEKVT